MPTYVYECKQCNEQTELVQKVSDPPLAACPSCEGPVRKVFFPVGIVFKGSGFHVNDYARPDKAKSTEDSSASKAPAGCGSCQTNPSCPMH